MLREEGELGMETEAHPEGHRQGDSTGKPCGGGGVGSLHLSISTRNHCRERSNYLGNSIFIFNNILKLCAESSVYG
jgi:hypothetical protein